VLLAGDITTYSAEIKEKEHYNLLNNTRSDIAPMHLLTGQIKG
jgi:hypothetical protein